MAETKKKAGRKPKAKAEAPVEAETANLEETVTEGAEEVTAEATLSAEAPEAAPVQDAQKSELDELKALVRQLQDELAARKPQVVQVMADTERVVMRWQAEVADDNLAVFGPGGMYGEITGKTGTITVPKSEWSRFYNESVRGMIARRWLIVLSGMDQQEREVYGCDYKPGELLDEKAFHKLLDLGRDLIAIFPALCRDHQAMVASRFLSAYLAGDRRAMDRDLIVALNELSKQSAGNDRSDLAKRGLFSPIIEGLNERDAQ